MTNIAYYLTHLLINSGLIKKSIMKFEGVDCIGFVSPISIIWHIKGLKYTY